MMECNNAIVSAKKETTTKYLHTMQNRQMVGTLTADERNKIICILFLVLLLKSLAHRAKYLEDIKNKKTVL